MFAIMVSESSFIKSHKSGLKDYYSKIAMDTWWNIGNKLSWNYLNKILTTRNLTGTKLFPITIYKLHSKPIPPVLSKKLFKLCQVFKVATYFHFKSTKFRFVYINFYNTLWVRKILNLTLYKWHKIFIARLSAV